MLGMMICNVINKLFYVIDLSQVHGRSHRFRKFVVTNRSGMWFQFL